MSLGVTSLPLTPLAASPSSQSTSNIPPVSTSDSDLPLLSSHHSPEVLANVASVLSRIQSEEQLVIVYFFAPWCGTCKKADPLYLHASRLWSSAQVLFTRFDCDPEEDLCEKTFGLNYVPCWKFWRAGKLVGNIEGDWTKFEPTLQELIGPPTDQVNVDSKTSKQLAQNHARFVELSKALGDKNKQDQD